MENPLIFILQRLSVRYLLHTLSGWPKAGFSGENNKTKKCMAEFSRFRRTTWVESHARRVGMVQLGRRSNFLTN